MSSPEEDGRRLLDPRSVRLERGPTGLLRLTLPDRCHLQVAAYRAFPLTDPDHWIVLLDARDQEIGTLEDPAALDPESRRLLEEELAFRYVVPQVLEIVRVSEDRLEGGHWRPGLVWDLRTDRGPLRLRMPNLQEHVRVLGPGRLLLLDRDGTRCEIRDAAALPPASRRWLERHLGGAV